MPLDPQSTAFLAAVQAASGPRIEDLPPAEGRQLFASLSHLFLPSAPCPRVENLSTASGVPLRLYYPEAEPANPLPGALFLHGGGWVLGDLDTHDSLCRQLCHLSGVVVAAVDYRRAPEHRFPVALNDAHAALQHLVNQAGPLHLDHNALAVAGDSAGGNLAAALCLRLRDVGGPRLRCQLLLYPVLDAGCDTDSYRAFATDHGLSRAEMRFFWQSYLGGKDGTDPLASPLRAPNLQALPPAVVITAEYDVLRDEGEAYAHRLAAAGVPVELRREAGMLHNFVHFGGFFDRGMVVLEQVAGRLRETLSA